MYRPKIELTLKERLSKRSVLNRETNCWLFKGCKDSKGYGNLNYKGKIIAVHRLSAFLFLGLDLNNHEQQANHKDECKNKHCWNPKHLYVGTQKQNVDDAVKLKTRNQRQDKKYCINGHKYTIENTYVDKKNVKRCRLCRIKHKIKMDLRTSV